MAERDDQHLIDAVRKQLKRLQKKNKLRKEASQYLRKVKEVEEAPLAVLSNAARDVNQLYENYGDNAENVSRITHLSDELLYKPLFKRMGYFIQDTLPCGANGEWLGFDHLFYINIDKRIGYYLWSCRSIDPDTGMFNPINKRQCGIVKLYLHEDGSFAGGKGIAHPMYMDEIGSASFANIIRCVYGTQDLEELRSYMQDEEVRDHVATRPHTYLSIAIQSMAWLHVNDYFPFEVHDAKAYEEYLNRYGHAPGVRKIIFLNTLPGNTNPQKSSDGVKQHSKSGHQRRGYWVTLRAERFKNHPMYMVHKGVYRQPSWVGPTSTKYQGNIYKVVLPGETVEDHTQPTERGEYA